MAGGAGPYVWKELHHFHGKRERFKTGPGYTQHRDPASPTTQTALRWEVWVLLDIVYHSPGTDITPVLLIATYC